MERALLSQLHPLVEVARRELARVDTEDVPVRLKRIARRSDRKLPPPFARVILEVLEADAVFRDAVRERCCDEGVKDELLLAYLEDPDQAREGLLARVSSAREQNAGELAQKSDRQIRELKAQLVRAKKRVVEVRASRDGEIRRVRDRGEDERVRSEERIRELATTLSQKECRIRELEEDVLSLQGNVLESVARAERILERTRRQSVDKGLVPRTIERQGESPTDPLVFAEWLDAVERTARPFRDRSVTEMAPEPLVPLTIPPGIAPDSSEVLQALLDQTPRRVIIDGYNVAGVLHGAHFSTRDARDDVVRRADRIARRSSADVIVVFDGSDEEGRSYFRSPEGVSVRFSRGETADDAIVELVTANPSRTVVVSNDREVRSRCAFDGCVAIWATAFV